MRRRKQVSNESLDDLLNDMLNVADYLQDLMSVSEIAVEGRYNFRSKLQHKLLHVDSSDLASLRRECPGHEEFFRSI